MSRTPKVWWNAQKGTWCTEFSGRHRTLAKGKGSEKQAQDALQKLLDEHQLLQTVGGQITVARLCEEFLTDAQENLEPATYESYRYGCQKLVDQFGKRFAHTIRPLDIQAFSIGLKSTLNDTSRAIVLRTVQRCFNWGVQSQLIPPHNLGHIRKPQSKTRNRYLTDDEFQAMLRATNPRNGHRSGACFRRFLLALDWTLCRPGEISGLRWEHIHLDRNVAVLTKHKTKRTGKPKVIPLIAKMKYLLTWMRERTHSEYCFVNFRGEPWTMSAIEQRMVHIKQRCHLEGVVPYTIRHRAATNAIIRTGDLKMTSLLLGHASTATTERYTHLAQEHLVNFAQKAAG